jgi:hypothetical protein
LEDTIWTIKNRAKRANKDSNEFKVLLLTYPKIVDSKSDTVIEKIQRFPLTGTVDQMGDDINSHSWLQLITPLLIIQMLP